MQQRDLRELFLINGALDIWTSVCSVDSFTVNTAALDGDLSKVEKTMTVMEHAQCLQNVPGKTHSIVSECTSNIISIEISNI